MLFVMEMSPIFVVFSTPDLFGTRRRGFVDDDDDYLRARKGGAYYKVGITARRKSSCVVARRYSKYIDLCSKLICPPWLDTGGMCASSLN